MASFTKARDMNRPVEADPQEIVTGAPLRPRAGVMAETMVPAASAQLGVAEPGRMNGSRSMIGDCRRYRGVPNPALVAFTPHGYLGASLLKHVLTRALPASARKWRTGVVPRMHYPAVSPGPIIGATTAACGAGD